MTKIFMLALILALSFSSVSFAADAAISDLKSDEETRVFAKDTALQVKLAKFHNRYGIDLVGHLYLPKDFNASKKYAAIAVSGPFGAVKEQSSGLYAQEMAKAGYVAIAFDPSFTGESGGVGSVRNIGSLEINTEDFSAAIDFLATRDFIDAERLGIIGICGWGGMAINAAAADTRIKATVSTTMYDMSRVTANGYFDAGNNEKARYEMRKALNAQRTLDYKNGSYARAGGVIDPLPDDAPQFVKDYYAYYKMPRGYHARSVNSNEGWNTTSALPLANFKLLAYSNEIRTPVLIIHGEKAHSRYFSEDAFKNMTANSEFKDNKELVIIPDASHVDLYDNFDKIPFAKIKAFFNDALLK
ncbi:MAG: alpha/beta hydrolase [Synergistaceae bacterium]|nr:alpha/beta hydrolase [Synergistaceae bacterium]